MISRLQLDKRTQRWGIGEVIAEKDYVLGWLLWGIGSEPALRDKWVFKGGTCIKKCYLPDHRFSQDLDFTVLEGGPVERGTLLPILRSLLNRVSRSSGIDFSIAEPRLDEYREQRAASGRIYYIGPRLARREARLTVDLTAEERVVTEPEWRTVLHDYPDALPAPAKVLCYPLVEVFAEKIRAMGERGRPRDLYDIISLFRWPHIRPDAARVRAVLVQKCSHKGVAVPTLESLRTAPTLGELRSEWTNMLERQVAEVPQFDEFWNELGDFFAWLDPRGC